MKKLSIYTFWIFFICLCIRAYSYISDNDLKDKVTTNESLLNDDKRKTIALLNTLNDLTLNGTNLDNFREISSSDLKKQRRKDSIIINFIEDFYASKNNLHELSLLQKDIKLMNKKLDVVNSPLEYLDINLLYYFVIKENFDLRDFQKNIIFEDIGFNREKMLEIRKYASSKQFNGEILKFKNIKTEKVIDENFTKLENENNKDIILEEKPREKPKYDFLQPADEQEVNLEEKLIELDYTPEEVEEMLSGFEL